MRVLIEVITVLAADFYASRSIAIGRAWRAARRTRGPGAALSEFRSGYGRAALRHSILAAVGSVGSRSGLGITVRTSLGSSEG